MVALWMLLREGRAFLKEVRWAKFATFSTFLNSFHEQNTNAMEDIFTSTDASIPLDSNYGRHIYVAFLVQES